MRRILTVLAMAVVACSGCKNGVRPPPGPGPAPVGAEAPTADQLVKHLNEQARAVQQMQSDKVSIAIKDGIKSITVSGKMVYEKPRHFRLMAEAFNKTVADVGSNDKEFWFWFRDQPDGLAYCSYEDLPKVRLSLPIHPDWIADALCVSEFGPANQYQLKKAGSNLELILSTTTPQGQKVYKVTTVANAGQNSGRIIGQRLRDERGNEIWSADINSYQQAGGFVVPKNVTIRQAGQKMEVGLTLGDVKVNNNTAGKDVFNRPSYGTDVNLAKTNQSPLGSPQSIEKVRGSSP